jgi:hypothetical protein
MMGGEMKCLGRSNERPLLRRGMEPFAWEEGWCKGQEQGGKKEEEEQDGEEELLAVALHAGAAPLAGRVTKGCECPTTVLDTGRETRCSRHPLKGCYRGYLKPLTA